MMSERFTSDATDPPVDAIVPPVDAIVPPVRRQCGTMAAYHRLCEIDPGFRKSSAEIERRTQRILETDCMRLEHRLLFRIPTVVHVVFQEPNQRVTKSQVHAQLKVLNRDYRLKNPNRRSIPKVWRGLAADAGIEFFLASVDPDGAASTGITYTRTKRESFGTGDSIKRSATGGIEPWDTTRYLNLWVGPLSGGLLGYAQFPGGPEETDGVVIAQTAFGMRGTSKPPFHCGRTATHEIGHYLNLFHLWGDTTDCRGTDHCCDTPDQQFPSFGKPKFPKLSCDNGPSGDMFMNYMDYANDEVMCLFTQAQAARMVATLTGPRSRLDPKSIPLEAVETAT